MESARRWRDPLIGYALLGAALFGMEWIAPPPRGELPPIPQGVEDPERWRRDEVLYREAIRLGLDREDPLIRGRLIQAMGFLLEGAPEPPDDEALRAWVAARPDAYRRPPRLAIEQIPYPDAEAARRALAATGPGDARPPDADASPLPLPSDRGLRTRAQIERELGADFAAAVEGVDGDGWSGPIPSPYGHHLVRILQRDPGGPAALEEVRAAATADWLEEARGAAREARLRALMARHGVTE